MRLFFWTFEFSPVFGKLKMLTFFSKSNFSVKFSQNMSTYSFHEYLQVKKFKLCDRCLRKLSKKKLLNLLRVLRGKSTLRPSTAVLLHRLWPGRRYAWLSAVNQLPLHDIKSFYTLHLPLGPLDPGLYRLIHMTLCILRVQESSEASRREEFSRMCHSLVILWTSLRQHKICYFRGVETFVMIFESCN